MTTVPRQLAIFAGVLAVLYTGGYAAGHIIGDDGDGGHGSMSESHGGGASHNPDQAGHGATTTEAHGLSSAENGLRLSIDASEIPAGRRQSIAFAVTDDTGAPVSDYDTTHTKKMHMILVRRDTSGFQHLHPTQDEAGLWKATTTIKAPGRYRMFADFSHEGEKTTLAGTITVRGKASYRPLPESAPLAGAGGGYEVRIDADATPAGEDTTLSFTVHKDGRAVKTQPYLGAGGHLVALREGDLAYRHVHPEDGDGEAVAFETAFPSAANYRLFLQFKHQGRVRTASFTHRVD